MKGDTSYALPFFTNRVPFPPAPFQEPRHTPHGLNTGVMLMNLTRMRQFPGRGWTGEVVTAFDTFVTVMTSTPSNRLVNIIFSQVIATRKSNFYSDNECDYNQRLHSIFHCLDFVCLMDSNALGCIDFLLTFAEFRIFI